MSIFKQIKEKSDILDVAKAMGINLNKGNMAICPFHLEKTPSFSISPKKQIYKCFGCNKGGDSISLVADLMNISQYESALYINELLNLGIDIKSSDFNNSEIKDYHNNLQNSNKYNYNNSKNIVEAFNNWENKMFLLLSEYRRELYEKNNDESAQMSDLIDYYLDIFLEGTIEEKLEFYNDNLMVVKNINDRFSRKNN